MGRGSRSHSRGNAYLVGVVLLVGLTLSAGVVILVVGQSSIDDTNQQSEVELVSQVFSSSNDAFRGEERSSVDVPEELQGELELNDETEYRLRVNDNEECSSGRRPLGTMQYENDETLVGYEGGGVWENHDGSASMRSPPDFTYDNGSMSLGFPNMTGSLTHSDQITAEMNESRQSAYDRNFSLALYTDLAYGETGDPTVLCPPSQLDNGTLWINESQFAPAWADYFRTNYDEPQVRVENSGSVEPGDSVKVSFLLGDVSNPDYEIRYIDYEYDPADDELVIDAKINNSGGLNRPQTRTFEWDPPSGSTGIDATDLALDPGENTTETLTIDDPDPGTHKITVATENESRRFPVEFLSSGGPADLEIQNTDAPPNATSGSDATVTATLENVGGVTANRTVTYVVTDADTGAIINRAERNVSLNASAGPTDFTFDVETTVPGRYAWRIEADGESESGHIAIGSRPYYRVADVESPTSVDAYNTYELDAEIRNDGHLSGEMPVHLVVEDTDGNEKLNETTRLHLDGSANTGSMSDTLTLTNSFTAGEQGQYRYVVSTPNQTRSGAFVVGEPDHPVFAIDGLELSPRPAEMRSEAWTNVTVTNVGTEQDRQNVEMRAPDGAILWSAPLTLAPGETYTLRERVTISTDHFENNTYQRVTVSTANTSADASVFVEPFESVEACESGICAEQEINAEISMLGAELEARAGDEITNGPVQMRLEVEADGTTETTELWRDQPNDGDVNDPRAEKTMVQKVDPYDPTYERTHPYKHNLTLGEGSRISVFTTSYACGDARATSVEWVNIMWGWFDATGYECDYGYERIEISQDENSDNVVILEDGDDVPSFGAADPYQRGLTDMLGSRIHGNGTLDLAPGERVFLYELSMQGADPDDASGNDDPDYNDAVALFRTTSIEQDNASPNLTIVDTDVPASLDTGYSGETASVTVENVGDAPGRSNVTFALSGSDSQSENVQFDPGESRTLTFDIPEGKPADSYPYYVDVRRHSDDTAFGTLTIGQPARERFQITSLSAPSVVGDDADPEADVTVTNTGSVSGTQDVILSDGSGSEVSSRDDLSLGPGSQASFTLDLPDGTANESVDYEVETENMSTGTRSYYVGTSVARIDQAIVGTTGYAEHELVERRQLDAMTVKVLNNGTIGDTREVTLDIDTEDGTDVWSDSQTVSLGSGRIYSTYPNWATFENVNGSGLSTGYYDYTITASGSSHPDRTWSGRLYITEEADVSSSQNTSSPISVDSSQVVVG